MATFLAVVVQSLSRYRKTSLISTYVFSGLVAVWVLVFGGRTSFRGFDKAEWKLLQGRSLFNPVISVDNTLLCMFQRLCTSFQDTGVLLFGGYVLSGHFSRQKISVKNEEYLEFFSEEYLFTGFYGITTLLGMMLKYRNVTRPTYVWCHANHNVMPLKSVLISKGQIWIMACAWPPCCHRWWCLSL